MFNGLTHTIVIIVIFILFMCGIFTFLYIKHVQMELESCQLKSEKLQLLISEQNNSIDKLSDDSKLEVQKIKDNQMRYNNEYLEEMNALNPTFNEVVPSDCNAAIKWGIDKAKEITNDNT